MSLSRFTTEQLVAFMEHNEGVRRARLEYEMHPRTGRGEHTERCASLGCPDGRAAKKGKDRDG